MIGKDRVMHRLLERTLLSAGYDLTDLVPLPSGGDRITRARTLEETVAGLDAQGSADDGHCYIVRVRPKQINPAETEAPPEAGDAEVQQRLYMPDGKINAPYLEHNAEVLLSHGEFALARNVYKTLLQSGLRTAPALYGMGLCFEREGRLDLALEKYEESVSYNPSAEVFLHMIGILVRQKKDRYGAEVAERALNAKDISPETAFELRKTAGNCWLRSERFDEAERQFFKALEIRPAADEVRSNLGSLYLKQRRVSEAKRAFQDATASNPGNDKAQLGLAVCLEHEGNKREAFDCFVRAVEANLANVAALYGVMRLAYELKNFAAAERLGAAFCESQPISVDVLYSLAGMQFHLGKLDAAQQTIAKIIELRPGHPGAQELLQRMNRF